MALNDPIANMLSTIRNGQLVRLAQVKCPSSKMRKGVLDVLKGEGYIKGYAEEAVRGNIKEIRIDLKYYEGEAVIKNIEKISVPGRRIYSSIDKLPKVNNGLGIAIVSTSKGIMADHEARAANIGGEVLCKVF